MSAELNNFIHKINVIIWTISLFRIPTSVTSNTLGTLNHFKDNCLFHFEVTPAFHQAINWTNLQELSETGSPVTIFNSSLETIVNGSKIKTMDNYEFHKQSGPCLRIIIYILTIDDIFESVSTLQYRTYGKSTEILVFLMKWSEEHLNDLSNDLTRDYFSQLTTAGRITVIVENESDILSSPYCPFCFPYEPSFRFGPHRDSNTKNNFNIHRRVRTHSIFW